ncbi:MAG TPA: Calx-beta domain-containing protein [Tepidisphaeraceae bacterium]|nr:Calx-beta domain-containing protein [Tepidisphaeraceae bacterium]
MKSSANSTSRFARRPARRSAAAARPSPVEPLESRLLLTTFTVTNNLDSRSVAPVGSLRWAIVQSNVTPGLDTIAFNLPAGQRVIKALGHLPTLTDPVVLNAATQPGYAGKPLVQLDGSLAGRAVSGLRVYGGNTVRGLAITNFNASGIDLFAGGPTAKPSTIVGNWIGLDLAGNAAGNNANGIYVASPGNTIGGATALDRNVISASRAANGVFVQNATATGNVIKGNYIGTDPTGTQARANFHNGVGTQNAPNTQIINNLISGNNDDGIILQGAGSTGNVVQGNLVGVNVTGTAALPNRLWGIEIQSASNTIGGTLGSQRNVFSGNGQSGVVFYTLGSTKNTVAGNYIGTDITGTVAIPNAYQGIAATGATGNSVVRNLISGNKLEGIGIFPSSYITVQGNTIGFTSAGKAMPNGTWAVVMVGGGIGNVVGGTAAGQGNYVATHSKNPAIYNSGGTANTVVGNVSTPPTTVTPTPTPTPNPTPTAIAGQFKLSVGNYSARENAGSITVTVTRSAGTNVAANIGYATQNGTALAGVDYTAVSGTLSFAAGQTSKTVTVPLLNDAVVEANEWLAFKLFSPTSGATLATPNVATLSITNDDGPTATPAAATAPAVVEFASAAYSVAEDNGFVKVTIVRSGDLSTGFSVKYATTGKSARTGSDFAAKAGTLSFAPGQIAATLRIPILDDATGEASEAFTVALGNAHGALIGRPSVTTVTILNDDSRRSAKIATPAAARATTPFAAGPSAAADEDWVGELADALAS